MPRSTAQRCSSPGPETDLSSLKNVTTLHTLYNIQEPTNQGNTMTDQQETIKEIIDDVSSFIASPQSEDVLKQVIENLIKDLKEELKSVTKQ